MRSDFRVDTAFFFHTKTQKLQRRLGSDGVLALLRLWGYAAERRTDGVLSGMDKEDIAIACGWNDEANTWVDTLVGVGFLNLRDDGVFVIHDWAEHQPWLMGAKARQERARASAMARWAMHKNGDEIPRCAPCILIVNKYKKKGRGGK